ncbi:hypothetical protein BASA81_018218 [Batrachochytrium salamandrivorans]|nr:hypothetical protein BASA81_018218 [Batrachochytrium salamandrivorans]
MANSDISVPSVDSSTKNHHPSTTFSIYTALQRLNPHTSAPLFSLQSWVTRGACLQDRPPHHKTRCSIPHNGPLKTDNATSSSASSAKASKLHWRIRQNYRHRRPDQPRPTAPPPPLSRQILGSQCCHYQQQNVLLSPYLSGTPGSGPSQRPVITSSKFRFTVPGFDVIQHPATGPGRRGIALGHSGATTNYSRREAFASIRQALDRVVPFDNNHPVLILETGTPTHSAFSALSTRGVHGLTVMQFSGSQITRLSTVHGRRHSSIDHFVCNAPARALLTSPRVDRQTAVADHFVIRTSIRAEAQGQPPVPRAPINIPTSLLLESANAVADNLSLRLSPPATRSNRRLLSGTTKRAILASNTARASIHCRCYSYQPDPVQCNTLRDEWSRLKAYCRPTREEWMVVNNGSSTLTISTVLYQTIEPISYSMLHVAMSGNSSRSAAVTPLYNSDGIVQYDPTSILRVMQGHYGSLAADTTGHSLDLQYWHDRQPIQVSPNIPPNQKQ